MAIKNKITTERSTLRADATVEPMKVESAVANITEGDKPVETQQVTGAIDPARFGTGGVGQFGEQIAQASEGGLCHPIFDIV